MKKYFNKKILIISLGLLFLITAIPIITIMPKILRPENSLADTARQYYTSTTTATLSNIISQVSDSTTGTSTVVNLSDDSIFVPNKSSQEWNTFATHTPRYVRAATCPDGNCEEDMGETEANCPADCLIEGKNICGNGICETYANTPVFVHYDPPKEDISYQEVCTKKLNGLIFIPTVNIFVLLSGNMYNVKCHTETQTVSVYYGWDLVGETWGDEGRGMKICKDDCAPPPRGSDCDVF